MAIFKSWFIDFEPFRDGEFVYSEELEKEIPKGWEVKRLGEVVKIESGGSAPQKEEYFIGGKNPFVRVKHLTNYPCVEEADFINDEAVKQCNLKLYNEGSIIFQRSGESLSFGRVNILPFNAYIVNHLAVIPNLPSNKLLMEFLFFTLKNILIELIEERSGTALPYIKISDIEKKEILLPPPHILQSFHSLVEPLFQKIILNQKQIMTLKKVRDTLLPLLVFGKLRVEEV
jgi:type I restriction enzyme S subunit